MKSCLFLSTSLLLIVAACNNKANDLRTVSFITPKGLQLTYKVHSQFYEAPDSIVKHWSDEITKGYVFSKDTIEFSWYKNGEQAFSGHDAEMYLKNQFINRDVHVGNISAFENTALHGFYGTAANEDLFFMQFIGINKTTDYLVTACFISHDKLLNPTVCLNMLKSMSFKI